jgi:hypothetical protein
LVHRIVFFRDRSVLSLSVSFQSIIKFFRPLSLLACRLRRLYLCVCHAFDPKRFNPFHDATPKELGPRDIILVAPLIDRPQ